MITIAEAIRPYWAFGINNITVQKSTEFSKWLSAGFDYQVYSQILVDSFEISVSERKIFLAPICFDCNRFSMSCFESAIKIEESNILPKSLSWLLVKLYYSAFYSGHYILRILGYSLSQLEKGVTNEIEKIADLYGNKNGVELQKGFYQIDFSDRSNTIKCNKTIKTGEDGSHGAMWKLLSQKIAFISNDILSQNRSTDYQIISTKLADLNANLHFMGSNNGGWLSRVRNDINYKHKYGTWFPYSDYQRYYSELENYLHDWKDDPLKIELSNLAGKELVRFISTCQFLIGTARAISIDMSQRCSCGKSFQINGPISLLNLARINVI